MLYTSVAILALSASSVVSPISGLLHLHTHMATPSARVELSIYNSASAFRDVAIAGETYTIQPHQSLLIKAMPGTVVYDASNMGNHKRGDVLLDIEPKLKGQRVVID